MTYREARDKVSGMLAGAGVENETAESWFLMEHSCGADRSFYLLHQQEEMPEDELQAYLELAEKRCQRIPLQHLTGEQEFMGLPFFVNEHVLIPRQDTEILAEKALQILKNMEESPRVMDLCTGSGCIAVSIKAYQKNAVVEGFDISREALNVAERNASDNQTEVKFVQSDLFSEAEGRYDMIVSNPPYIPSAVIPTLMPEVRDHEPVEALDGMEDGLYFYRKIVAESGAYLKPGGYLLFEIGAEQGAAVSGLMREYEFEEIEVIPDLAGLDRVVKGRRRENV